MGAQGIGKVEEGGSKGTTSWGWSGIGRPQKWGGKGGCMTIEGGEKSDESLLVLVLQGAS